MSLSRLSEVVARRARSFADRTSEATVNAGAATPAPTPQQLLDSIGTYIPTEITTAYIAVAGGIATIPGGATRRTLFVTAIGIATLSGFAAWVGGHMQARTEAQNQSVPPPRAIATLRAGWFEVLAAAIAFFVWATAMPGSWYEWGANLAWAPVLLVFTASLLIGGLAILLNR